MNTSVPHILESDADPEWGMAKKAGWRRADLTWEHLQEEGNALMVAGDGAGAAKAFRRAARIAFWRFSLSDPRRATSLANLALCDRLADNEKRARRRYAKARRIWAKVDGFIAGMEMARRARSSLFHLRMEAKHWDTYQENMRIRMTAFAGETAGALAALEEGDTPECRLFGRWRGEKPSIFDDTRIFLAAALMIGVSGKERPVHQANA